MITVKNLQVDYEDVNAVKNVSFDIKAGQIYGLVGPNGAGKTSTIKALAGILEPTLGEIKIDGMDYDLNWERVSNFIGYVPDFSPVYDHLKVWEYLDVFAAAYLISAENRPEKIKYWLEKVNLSGKRDSFVKELSRGMKQRLVLAKTLLVNPKVLLLDEPASGLDPIARREMRDVLKEAASEGKAIIISSHILSELSDMCNAIGIMEKGSMICSGSLDDIRAHIKSKNRLMIKLVKADAALINNLIQFLSQQNNCENIKASNDLSLDLNYSGSSEEASLLLNQLIHQSFPVSDFHLVQETIEDIFFKIGAMQVS